MNPIVLAPTSLASTAPLEYIDAAVRAGYDGIGIRLFRSPGITYAFYPVAGDAALTKEVKSAISAAGMPVYDILSFYMQPETDIDSMLPPLELGAEIGGKYALVIGDDPDWGRMVENFGRFCDAAGRFGLTASIEAPVSQRVVNKLDMALGLIRESGRQNAVVCLDPYHFYRTGHTPADLKGQDQHLFPYTQIDDGGDDEKPPAGRCGPGEGSVPLYEMFDLLSADLPLSLEWAAPRDSGHTAASWAKFALDHTRKYMEEYHASRAARV